MNKRSQLLFFVGMFFISLSAQTVDKKQERTLYVVSTAHFDTQWNWTIQESINKYIPSTFNSNFALFEKYPDYKFNFEGAIKYLFMKEYYPEAYQRVKEYIAQGRWNICGSSLDATDCYLASPESMIRTILLGQNFYKKEFGVRTNDIFLPDCFGFGYSLPTIMNHCGLKGFSSQKLTWGSPIGVPFDLGVWEGVDGSKVIAALNPGSYTSKIRSDLSNDKKGLETIDKTGNESGLFAGYKYYGTGDIGGAPDDSSVIYLEKSLKVKGPIQVKIATAGELYNSISADQKAKLPQYKGELLTSPHGNGCYTSQTAMKMLNRRNEMLGDAAERASVAASWLGGIYYPKEKLDEAWKRFLWHQFHDDLTGTSIPAAYNFSWNDEILSLNQFAAVLENATGSIARSMDTRVKGSALVVYNPLAIQRQDVVEAEVLISTEAKSIKVFDKLGNEVPSQVLGMNGKKVKFLFIASCQPVSWQVFDVVPSQAACTIQTGLKISRNAMENEHYKLLIDKNGDVSSIYDKIEKKETLKSPVRLQLLDDKSVNWPAWEIMYNDVQKSPRAFFNAPQISIVENGAARVTLKIKREKDGSVYEQFVSLSAQKAGDKIEFYNQVDWKTQGTLLKVAFNLAVSNPKATYDLGIGTIERTNNQAKIYEVPALRWADLSNESNKYGVSILSDYKMGWDKPDDSTLRLTLLHTPETGASYAYQASNDIGINTFKFAIAPHSGDWQNGETQQKADRLNQPLVAFQTEKHEGNLGSSFSFVSVNNPQVGVQALKLAENSDEMVLRLQELHGKAANDVKISFPTSIISAKEINGMEEVLGEVKIANGQLQTSLMPYQPRAYLIKISKSKNKISKKTSQPLGLPFDLDGISPDANRADGDVDGDGNTYAAELWKTELMDDDVVFKMGSAADGQKNFLTCNGQTLQLPEGAFNTVYVLAASTKEDMTEQFKVDGTPVSVAIPYYSGNIGQWDTRKMLNTGKRTIAGYPNISKASSFELLPAFMKRVPVAYVGTHRHLGKSDENEAYIFTYLFKIVIQIPKGAKTMTLPNNENLKIAAITLSNDSTIQTKPAQLLYENFERKTSQLSIRSDSGNDTFGKEMLVSLNCSDVNLSIFYTLDGSQPTEQSIRYNSPVRISETTHFKAIGCINGVSKTNVATASFYKLQLQEPVLVDKSTLKNGVLCKVFDGKWSEMPDWNKEKAVSEQITTNFDLPKIGMENHFGVTFDGYIEIDRDDLYHFYTSSDDGSMLYIDDVLVVDNNGYHGEEEAMGLVALKAGIHKISVQFFQGTGGASLSVAMERKNKNKAAIDSTVLFYK